MVPMKVLLKAVWWCMEITPSLPQVQELLLGTQNLEHPHPRMCLLLRVLPKMDCQSLLKVDEWKQQVGFGHAKIWALFWLASSCLHNDNDPLYLGKTSLLWNNVRLEKNKSQLEVEPKR